MGLLLLTGTLAAGQEARRQAPGYAVLGKVFIALQVPDDAASAAWYKRVLSLDEIKHLEAQDERYSIRVLRGQGLTVELIRANNAKEVEGTPRGLFKAGFFVDDIEAAFQWMRSQEVDTDQRIFTDESLNVRFFVFRDLNGNRLQVFADAVP